MQDSLNIWGNYFGATYFSKMGLNQRRYSFAGINLCFGFTIALLILLAGFLDGTFILPGSGIGLLEHPVIWCFIGIQMLSPFMINKAIKGFEDANSKLTLNSSVSPSNIESYYAQFVNGTALKSNANRLIWMLLTLLGLIAFAWNSFQNQQPLRFLGFDFWDSIYHPYGYWITRVYKFYLWVLLFPALVHVEFVLFRQGVSMIKEAYKSGSLKLEPFHSDKAGGFKITLDYFIKPINPILILVGIATLIVVLIHKKPDFTVISGLLCISTVFSIAYLIPSWQISIVIKAEKKRLQDEINAKQNSVLDHLLIGVISANEETDNQISRIVSWDKVIDKIDKLPAWPYFKFVAVQLSLVNLPSIGLIIIKHFVKI
jgi:hypothetical protein